MRSKKISKLIAYVLRHHPEELGLSLDTYGWCDTEDLLKGIQTRFPDFTLSELEEIVKIDSKQRYGFNEDHTKIRANQGHSVLVDVELEEIVPPDVVYHGTAERFTESIEREGIKSMSRLYVHLSRDTETAKSVGSRHGKPVIYEVNARKMVENGIKFFVSKNGVILVKEVPADYLKRIK